MNAEVAAREATDTLNLATEMHHVIAYPLVHFAEAALVQVHVEAQAMGFCRRCGDIVVGPRCKCKYPHMTYFLCLIRWVGRWRIGSR